MMDPASISTGSIMPRYPWLFEDKIDFEEITNKMEAMQTLGVPYTDADIAAGADSARRQAQQITNGLMLEFNQNQLLTSDEGLQPDHEILALIAYLQRLGRDAAPVQK
jgi:cytochrome c oxidase cbb3-type subunit I/II